MLSRFFDNPYDPRKEVSFIFIKYYSKSIATDVIIFIVSLYIYFILILLELKQKNHFCISNLFCFHDLLL